MVPLTLLLMVLVTLMHSASPRRALGTAAPDRRRRARVRLRRASPVRRRRRRGVRLSGEPGQTVRAPCSGRVLFAGTVPGLGPGVSLRCGRLAATEFGLERAGVRARGAVLIAGGPVGRLGSRGSLVLGARVVSDRWGYLDPLALLGGAPDRPLGPAPRPPRVKLRRPAPPPAAPGPAGTAAPSPLPLTAWIGAAVAGMGGGLGVTLRRRSRRSRSRGAAAVARRPGGTG